MVQSNCRAKDGMAQASTTHLFSTRKVMFFSGIEERNPKPVAALSQVGGFQPAVCQRDFGRRWRNGAPCQIVRMVTRFARTR
jgi:hypothetical protein